ncbi:ATP-binding protein [Candidatus Peregrinibacteria bacterium]|nr:ATP-binding protein [Candidatus Peregrinibacteria bacterium]
MKPREEVESSSINVLVNPLRAIGRLLDRLRKKMFGVMTHQSYEHIDTSLSPEEYDLPPEMKDDHPVLVSHLTSNQTNQAFSHSGILMVGIHGSGKTEYARYLAHQTEGRTKLVSAHISDIRNSHSPGSALLTLYRELEAKALSEGMYYVILFDEFDKLMSKFSSMYTEESHTVHQSGGEKSRTQTHDHKKTMYEIDAIGDELLSTLKTILSGTGGISRVFTLATSNQTFAPPELTRPGRLKKVLFKPLEMPEELKYFTQNDRIECLAVYSSLSGIIPRTLRIMQATHFRQHRVVNEVILSLQKEMDAYFSDAEITKMTEDNGVIVNQSLGPKRKFFNAQKNFEMLKQILFILNVEFGALTYRQQKTFGGALTSDGSSALYELLFHHNTPAPDLRRFQGLTSAIIAAHYKENQSRFSVINDAKKAVAELLFPQLLDPEGLKADY